SDESNLEIIGTLFGSDAAKVLVAAEDLLAPVGDQGFSPREEAIQARGVPLEVFGKATSLDASADGQVLIHPAASFVGDLFATGETYQAPPGTALAALDLGGKLSLATQIPPLSFGALTLAVTGSATAGFRYRHLLPVRQADRRGVALAALAASTFLPQKVRLEHIQPGEVHRLDALLTLSFGLEARWGKEFDLNRVLDLWDGLAAEVRAHVAATVQASLGWSLYEEMHLTVGSANLLNPDWVRIRLERKSERRFTLGAVVQVLVDYDASSVAMILQQTLDQSPLPRVVEALKTVAAGDWDAIKGKLTARAEATLDEWLNDTGWQEWAANSKQVQQLVKTANQIVQAYDGLDSRIGSLWDRLLGSADLQTGQPLRKALETVAALQGKSLMDLIEDPEAKEALTLFELLTGKSVEEVLLSGDAQIQALVDEAARLAQQALAFVDGLPATARKQLTAYADRLKIPQTLAWLRDHASSKEALIAAVDQAAQKRIRQLVELLLGKAWDAIPDADLARVQAWAQRLSGELDRLQQRLAEALQRFKGELGFSLSVALDRATRDEALIDLEIDPRNPQLATAVPKALVAGKVRDLLEALPDLADKGEKEETVPAYLLRESVLSHRKVRTNSLSTLFHFLGIKSFFKAQSQWAEEGRLKISQTPSGFERQGLYSGGLIRSSSAKAADLEASLWLEISAQDAGAPRPLSPFPSGSMVTGASITFTYDDRETQEAEQEALDELLFRLGFLNLSTSLNNIRRRLDGETVESRFALTLRLGSQGVEDLLGGLTQDAGWNESYLTAAGLWYRLTVPPAGDDGEVLAALTELPDFRQQWLAGPVDLTRGWADTKKQVEVDGKTRQITLLRDPNNINQLARWKPDYSSLYWLANNRGRGLVRFRSLVATLGPRRAAGGQRHPPAPPAPRP
ncbi:MAG: hypothetical protein KDD47_21625, partial [Acidobacteria bacterium]|nr:hypothetical protein [Acidobacteriota bacterium]